MRRIVLLLPVMLVLLLGCATVPKEMDLKESLRSKAEEYWKLRLQDRYEETYKMEYKTGLPGFAEYKETAQLIKKFKIESFSIGKVEVAGEKGTVTVRVSVLKPPIPVPVKDVFTEEWIFQDGDWWHIMRLK